MTLNEIECAVLTYWEYKPLGPQMLDSENLDFHDLLLLIPNNKKKMLGIPMTRIAGRRKHFIKKQQILRTTTWKLWDILSETIDNILNDRLVTSSFFQDFVDIKSIELGDPVPYEL